MIDSANMIDRSLSHQILAKV
ncbi:hypothetical protein ALT785_330008 [Alteromonas infernus]